MKFIKTICALGVVMAAANVSNVLAKVSPEEAARLGKDLTPIGAEKAGNKDGTIPEWTGGMKKSEIPSSFKDDAIYPDPYGDEKPLFTITAANIAQYAGKLTEGQKAVFKRYPDTYKMNVYPTHRSVSVEKSNAEDAKYSALNATLTEEGQNVGGWKGFVPFPIPKAAQEITFNHVMRPRGSGSASRSYVQVTPMTNGDFTPVEFYEEYTLVETLTDADKVRDPNGFMYFKQLVTSPARLSGNVLLAQESKNQVKEPRRAWVYNAGQRRVRLAPQVAYDGPGTAADGMRTTDNFDMFNGATDRYNWKIIGKKEIYIPYNSYKLEDKSLKYTDVVKAGHLNQDYPRYELHRVWVVEGTLKEGQRHIYAKRVFFIDEDSWFICLTEHYDGRGTMWRVGEGHNFNRYSRDPKFEFGGVQNLISVEPLYDLLSGRYVALGLANEIKKREDITLRFKSEEFTPAALRRMGVR